MNSLNFQSFKPIVIIFIILSLSSCTAGNPQFTQDTPAGIWYGLWHGMISVITLIIHLFNENVAVYEVNNTGGWYDFGFLLGVIMIWSGGSHVSCKSAADKRCEQDWDEVGKKVERKVFRKLKQWAEDEESGESLKEWEEIGEKVEKKLKRKIREWAEED